MSNQFTTDPIETLDDWNAVLTNGCCCTMPSCPIPSIVCQNNDGKHEGNLIFPIAEPESGEIPRLYATATRVETGSIFKGTAGAYMVSGFLGTYQQEELVTAEYNDTSLPTSETHTANYYDPDIPACGPSTDFFYGDFNPAWLTISEELGNIASCDETTFRGEFDIIHYVPGTPRSLHGCPGPFNLSDESVFEVWCSNDFVRHDLLDVDLSGPETKQTFRDKAALTLPIDFDHPDGSFCVARYSVTHDRDNFYAPRQGWPTKESVSDFWDWSWEGCEHQTNSIHVITELRDVRYRWHIPEDFKGSYFKITWDVLTEPDGWNDTINDPDNPPPDPLPEGTTEEQWWADHQIPKPGRPSRSYVQDLTVEWTGPGTAIPDPVLDEGHNVTNQDAIDTATATWYTPWNDLNPPPEPGTRRVVNIRFECYRGPYGTKPQLTGEGVDLTEDTPLQKRFTSKRHGINIPLTF